MNTKYGPVKTDHVLFIAAGAFHVSKVSDLIPELQGRFPVRVDLKPLTVEDYKRILTQPENALIRQYQLLLGVDGVRHTLMERILSDIAFNAGGGDAPEISVQVNAEYVKAQLSGDLHRMDVKKYIL